jgi:hypothetical protein
VRKCSRSAFSWTLRSRARVAPVALLLPRRVRVVDVLPRVLGVGHGVLLLRGLEALARE